jgi:uncharacterized membrane protein
MSKHTKERQIQVTEPQYGGTSVTATETETHVFPILPLPSAAEFSAFEIAVPGTGERILSLIEKQFEHRCKQEIARHEQEIAKDEREAKQQDEDNKVRDAGLAVGLVVLVLFAILAFIFALMGRQMEAVAAIIAPMVAFAIAVLKYTAKR